MLTCNTNTPPFPVSLPACQSTTDDHKCHKQVTKALQVIGFSQEEIDSIYKILATILLLV